MIPDEKVKELIKKAHEVAKDSFKQREIVNEIFYNLKAHLQANKTIEEIIIILKKLINSAMLNIQSPVFQFVPTQY